MSSRKAECVSKQSLQSEIVSVKCKQLKLTDIRIWKRSPALGDLPTDIRVTKY